MARKCNFQPECNEVQTHVHEFEGSTELATIFDGRPALRLLHNHRFTGVTSQVQPCPTKSNPRDHTHTILVRSDFFLNHFHEVSLQTGPVIPIIDPVTNRPVGHVHAVVGTSSRVFCHEHDFKAATLIQNPINGPFTTIARANTTPPPVRREQSIEDDDYYDDDEF